MILNPDLVYRILLAIEAKPTRTAGSITVEGADEQDVLNHLAAMHAEALYDGPRPHISTSSGEVDLAPVRDLTPSGRERLREMREEQKLLSAQSSAWGSSWAAPVRKQSEIPPNVMLTEADEP